MDIEEDPNAIVEILRCDPPAASDSKFGADSK